MLKYRPEIDGLRAVSVLVVIIYHADIFLSGYRVIKGGFIGVDIFFVISGYLITSILLRQMCEARFTFLSFYERRARRILPVLFLVTLTCIPFAWIHMFPVPLVNFAKSVTASTLFGSNFLFWMRDGYTAEPNALKPLLHTWSLSLEEQFYLLFPVLLLFCWKFARKYITGLLLLGFISSLILAHWVSQYMDPSTSFFLLPTRGWELLAGALLAKYEYSNQRSVGGVNGSLMPLVGALLLVFSFVFFDDLMPHPSFLTLAPVIGTALIIQFGGGNDFVSRILSSRLLVGIGLISYSLYLWHQPVFAFARIRSVNELLLSDKVGLLFLTLLLAVLSWHFVETPFRDKRKTSSLKLWTSLSFGVVILISFGVMGISSNGFPERVSPQLLALFPQKGGGTTDNKGKSCRNRDPMEACILGGKGAKTTLVLVGDSHARVISKDLWENTRARGFRFMEFTNSGCPYAPGMEVIQKNIPTKCTATYNNKRREILLGMKPAVIFLHSRLPLYLSARGFDNREGGHELFDDYYLRPEGVSLPHKQRVEEVKKQLKAAIGELLDYGHKLVLLYPVPEVGWDVPTYIKTRKNITSTELRLKREISTSYSVFLERVNDTYEVLDAVGNHRNVLRVFPERVFCDTFIAKRCSATHKDSIFYTDSHHLSPTGSKIFVDEIVTAFKTKDQW
jgi:peptidoglycan/LPS O-acetylase OafA/YrhL